MAQRTLLTKAIYRTIKNLRKQGKTYAEIRRTLKCSNSTLTNVILGRIDYSTLPE